jgi:hypothetical protein
MVPVRPQLAPITVNIFYTKKCGMKVQCLIAAAGVLRDSTPWGVRIAQASMCRLAGQQGTTYMKQ